MYSISHTPPTFEEFHASLLETLPCLKGFAIACCGCGADADDAVQLACEKALRHWDQWSGDRPFDHWLKRILVNAWRDELRSRKLRAGPSLELMPEPSDPDGDAADRLYFDQIRSAILRLPPCQRDVMLLVVDEGLSYHDAAEQLGVPIGTVMSRLCRARHTLIEKLEPVNG